MEKAVDQDLKLWTMPHGIKIGKKFLVKQKKFKEGC
jgi:hypothetical protein